MFHDQDPGITADFSRCRKGKIQRILWDQLHWTPTGFIANDREEEGGGGGGEEEEEEEAALLILYISYILRNKFQLF